MESTSDVDSDTKVYKPRRQEKGHQPRTDRGCFPSTLEPFHDGSDVGYDQL